MLFGQRQVHEVAWEQFCLQKGDLASADLINKGALQVKEDDNSLLISGRSFCCSVGKESERKYDFPYI